MNGLTGSVPHAVALGLGIALTAGSQILLRQGARDKSSWLHSFLNRRTILGYGIFLLVTILNVFALQRFELKTVTAWAALSYVLTPAVAFWLLREKIHPLTIPGALLIVAGIFVFTLGNF